MERNSALALVGVPSLETVNSQTGSLLRTNPALMSFMLVRTARPSFSNMEVVTL